MTHTSKSLICWRRTVRFVLLLSHFLKDNWELTERTTNLSWGKVHNCNDSMYVFSVPKLTSLSFCHIQIKSDQITFIWSSKSHCLPQDVAFSSRWNLEPWNLTPVSGTVDGPRAENVSSNINNVSIFVKIRHVSVYNLSKSLVVMENDQYKGPGPQL